MEIVIIIIGLSGLLFHLFCRYQISCIPRLSDLNIQPLLIYPKLSIIIPACDEADTVEIAMRTLLKLSYPHYEIIAINDRSRDETGVILDHLSKEFSQLQVIHIETLPTGWLGKLHALEKGTQCATGDLLLFADADVHFESGFMERVVAHFEHDQLDYLTLIPKFIGKSAMLKGLIFLFANLFCARLQPRAINQGHQGAYAGVGVFQLLRRSFFNQTEGWSWLRLEIADDTGLAYLCHRYRARARIYLAAQELSITWYSNVKTMVSGLEKNFFPVMSQFSLLRMILLTLIILTLNLGYLLFFIFGMWYLGLIVIILSFITVISSPMEGTTWWERTLALVMWPVLLWALLRSTWKTLRQGGIFWRGTFYPSTELKAHQRLKI
jgi:glycosyltransferase involved in cell wall biosynthesis